MTVKNGKRQGRKGISIAEMCVVLAVVAVVAVSVTSFTLLVSAQTKASVIKINAMDDLELAEKITEDWISKMLSSGAQTLTADGTKLIAATGGQSYTLTVTEGQLAAQLPGEANPRLFPLKTVTQLRFELMTGPESRLVICHAVYTLPNPGGEDVEQHFVFTVCPRHGQ